MGSKAYTQQSMPRSKFSIYLFIAGIASLIILGVISWSVWQNSSTLKIAVQVNAAPQKIGVEIGNVAPDFTLPTLGGGTFTLANTHGKPAIVFFMAYWCGSCIPEAIALGKLQQDYGDKVNIVAVNIDPSATWETIKQFKQAAGNPPLVWASDFDQKVALAYELRVLDTTFILDSKGRIVYRDEIPTQYDTLKSEMKKLQP